MLVLLFMRTRCLVAMRMPTDADAVPEVETAIACWSIHDASTEAAVAVMFGERPATGRIPLATIRE